SVHRVARRRHPDRRRPHLLPRRLARPDRRAAEPRKVVLMETMTPAQPTPEPVAARGVAQSRGLFDREILRQALVDALRKFDPRVQLKNPVMFVVLVGTVVTFIEGMIHPCIF